jgi:cysteinyl-tRNA synthetase
MLLVASVLTKVMMHKLTDPIQKVTDAAQRFGGGDLSVRVEGVDGEGEVADLARTFNKMADNIQSNDNSRGQFMGNIAHELRTPMTTIKGFIDGILDGTIPPEMQNHYLQLVSEKRNPADFALWKCAQPEHIMRWPSPWSNGFPGWHCECTAMGKKYLGEHFDIHGGGMDLIFPHHECEIAQSVASQGDDMVHYWMHNNMITINGQKMGKSYGNFINLDEFFHGTHKLLTQAYSPMTIRFFILQAHYRSTVDFSNEALQAAEKGLERLTEAVKGLERITPATQTTGIEGVKDLREKCYTAMNDDLNSPIVIAHLFDGARMINTVLDKKATISAEDLEELKSMFHLFMYEILGLKEEAANNEAREEAYGKVVDMLLEQRMKAKANKDWATSDKIRDELAALGFEVKDTKDGFTWKLNK